VKALDTNIVVRFLTADEPGQLARVEALLRSADAEREHLFVPLLVLLETIWVLTSVYEASRESILDSLERLTDLSFLRFEKEALVRAFLAAAAKTPVALADLLIGLSAREHGCETTLTFDKRIARSEHFSQL